MTRRQDLRSRRSAKGRDQHARGASCTANPAVNQLWKPSAVVKRIESGQGHCRDELAGYAEDDKDLSEWANLTGYEEIIAATIQEVEGDPKSVQEA